MYHIRGASADITLKASNQGLNLQGQGCPLAFTDPKEVNN
jgi:hypothetical protein